METGERVSNLGLWPGVAGRIDLARGAGHVRPRAHESLRLLRAGSRDRFGHDIFTHRGTGTSAESAPPAHLRVSVRDGAGVRAHQFWNSRSGLERRTKSDRDGPALVLDAFRSGVRLRSARRPGRHRGLPV